MVASAAMAEFSAGSASARISSHSSLIARAACVQRRKSGGSSEACARGYAWVHTWLCARLLVCISVILFVCECVHFIACVRVCVSLAARLGRREEVQ